MRFLERVRQLFRRPLEFDEFALTYSFPFLEEGMAVNGTVNPGEKPGEVTVRITAIPFGKRQAEIAPISVENESLDHLPG